MINENKPLLTLTDAAANRVKSLMKEANSQVIGLRIGIKTAGCSGMKYNVESVSYTHLTLPTNREV